MGLKSKTLLIAGIIEIVSLLFLGWNPKFLYGLALGTFVALGNFSLLLATSKLTLLTKKGMFINILGYVIRLTIYGGTFFISYRLGVVPGIGTLLGFMTLKIALYHEHGIRPGFKKQKKQEEV